MERTKKCRYCQKEFTAKRIDAKYCSDSCRQMSYRRQSDPHTFGKVVPIYFELDEEEYNKVLLRADEEKQHPNDFVKKLLIDEHCMTVKFTFNDWTTVINFLGMIYPDMSTEKMVREVFLKAANKEIEEYENE